MNTFERTDPLSLLCGGVALFLAASNDPWWTMAGAYSNRVLSIQVSPFYLHLNATGLASTANFAQYLGPLTRLLMFTAFLVLGLASLSPFAWWRELVIYFSLSVFVETYLSFILFFHAAETSLLGAYGVVAPYSGTARLPTLILGLDLNNYFQPLVNAGFSISFYIGFVSFGLIIGTVLMSNFRARSTKRGQRGVEAMFTSDDERA